MENNICSIKSIAVNAECSVGHLGEIKTLNIQKPEKEVLLEMMDAVERGQPLIIDAEPLYGIHCLINPKPIVLQNHRRILPEIEPAFQVNRLQPSNRNSQFKELELADISAETKKKIAAEYWRLCKQHPTWKAHRAMRKAGEKFNIKFELE